MTQPEKHDNLGRRRQFLDKLTLRQQDVFNDYLVEVLADNLDKTAWDQSLEKAKELVEKYYPKEEKPKAAPPEATQTNPPKTS